MKKKNRIRVCVYFKDWLKAKWEFEALVYKVPALRKIFGVGSGPLEFIKNLLRANKAFIGCLILKGSDASLYRTIGSENLVDRAAYHNVPIINRLDGIPSIEGFNGDVFKRKQWVVDQVTWPNAIVFQSQFSKDVYEKVAGEIKVPYRIIFNGVPDSLFDTKKQPKSSNSPFLIASRPDSVKRVNDMVRCFVNSPWARDHKLEIANDFIPIPEMGHPSVTVLGRLTPSSLRKKISMSKAILHMGWYDWCPNLVIESIALGTPVICSEVGGTAELVKASGVVSVCGDPGPDFMRPNMHVPELNQECFDRAIESFLNQNPSDFDFERPEFHLSNVAVEYEKWIKEIVAKNEKK